MRLRVLVVTLCFSFSLATAAEVDLVTTAYPPYFGPDLKDEGPIAEIVATAYERVGHTVKVRYVPWARAEKEAKAGTADGLLGVWHTEEREQWFLFSDEMPPNELVFFKRRGAKPETFTGYDELNEYKIGVVRGYAAPAEFARARLSTVVHNSDVLNLAALGRERVDLILIDKATARYLLATELPGFVDALVAVEPPVQVWPTHIGISKQSEGAQQKVADFNKGLGMLRAEGKIDWIMKKHGFR